MTSKEIASLREFVTGDEGLQPGDSMRVLDALEQANEQVKKLCEWRKQVELNCEESMEKEWKFTVCVNNFLEDMRLTYKMQNPYYEELQRLLKERM